MARELKFAATLQRQDTKREKGTGLYQDFGRQALVHKSVIYSKNSFEKVAQICKSRLKCVEKYTKVV